MFDPNLPQEGTPLDAVQMRNQLNGLKALIDAIPIPATAQVDGTTTLPPGASGEVTFAALSTELTNNTSANSNGVGTLGFFANDPPNQSDVQQIIDKVDELINALRR